MRLIAPILTRPKAEIQALATTECLDIDSCEIVDVANDVAAAMKGVELCQTGKTDALMKSSLHTDHLMHAVMQDETGLRTKRRFSHVFVRDGQEAQEAGE
jgi:phosphotransacetylase